MRDHAGGPIWWFHLSRVEFFAFVGWVLQQTHPGADTLFVEDIEIGQAGTSEIRTVCSGLVGKVRRTRFFLPVVGLATLLCWHAGSYIGDPMQISAQVPAEDMSGLCVVVCNLKARNMKGIKSAAMVLAAVGTYTQHQCFA